jgi:hypothetical protein
MLVCVLLGSWPNAWMTAINTPAAAQQQQQQQRWN